MKHCRLDVKNAIIDTILKKYVDKRYSYSRTENHDIIKLNNILDNSKTKISSSKQANLVADSLIKRLYSETNGHIIPIKTQFSEYDPIFIQIGLSSDYIESEFNKLSEKDNTPIQQEILFPEEVKYSIDNQDVISRALSYKDDIKGIYKSIFPDNPEEVLYELAVQLNSSESEAKTAKQTFGDNLSKIALELYPNAKVGVNYQDYIKDDKVVEVEILVKPGIQELFESNSDLAQIGTVQQYSQYLDTIFPDSKITEMDNSLYISVLEDLKSNKIIEKQCS